MLSRAYLLAGLAVVVVLTGGCGTRPGQTPATYVSLAEAEVIYGPLITAGNHPTAEQNGTGQRMGLFQDARGEIWGLPLIVAEDGAVAVCAPPGLRDAKVTGAYPAGASIVGATNAPTGEHGGTGKLEILWRDPRGIVRRQEVHGAHLDNGPVCWAATPPRLQLEYYRLSPR